MKQDTRMSGVTQQEEEKKPDNGGYINIKVKGRIKRTTNLRKLMNAYSDRQSMDFNVIAFLFDSHRLKDEHTPAEMEDGGEIDSMLHQTGGGSGV